MKRGRLTAIHIIKKSIYGLKDSWRITLLTALFVSGLIVGAAIVKSSDTVLMQQISAIIQSYIEKRATQSFLILFVNSIIPIILFLYLSFSSGLCAIGMPLIAAIPVIKGLGTGIIGAYLYSVCEIDGVCYCLLLYFPASIISTAILIFACNESFFMSTDLFTILKDKHYSAPENIFRLYITRYCILVAFTLLCSIFDAFLVSSFSGLFKLF